MMDLLKLIWCIVGILFGICVIYAILSTLIESLILEYKSNKEDK